MKPELISLLQDLSSAVSMMDNGLYRDALRNRDAVMAAARELADYYGREIEDGGEPDMNAPNAAERAEMGAKPR